MALDIIHHAVSFYLVPQCNFFVLSLAYLTIKVQNRHCFKNSFVISISKYKKYETTEDQTRIKALTSCRGNAASEGVSQDPLYTPVIKVITWLS